MTSPKEAYDDSKSTKSSQEEGSYKHGAPNEIILSPGVQRIDAIASVMDLKLRLALYISIFFISYAYGLDNSTRSTYQTEATNSYSTHSLLSTVSVIRTIVAAAAQPVFARIADLFGRIELLVLASLLYTVGTIIEASSHEVKAFSGGAILYQIGLTGIEFLLQVIIADTTVLRNRLVIACIPNLPYMINAWIGGNVTSSILANSTWRWGVAMWAIIIPILTVPIVVCLLIAESRAKRTGKLVNFKTFYQSHSSMGALLVDLFWRLDAIGVIFFAASISLILIPLTIAGGEKSTWSHGDIIAMIVIGILLLPVFMIWELRYARIPMMPFILMKDRSVFGSFGCFFFLLCFFYVQGDYLYTVVQVAFDQTVLSATRISFLYSFVSVIFGFFFGVAVRYIRRLKWFAVGGMLLFVLGLGLLIRFRGANGDGDTSGLIGGQIILGFAGGFVPYPVQTIMQAATKHEHVAMITSMGLCFYYIGGSIGSAISGAIWTNILPSKLDHYISNQTLAADAYAAPLTFILSYPVGTDERAGMIQAYSDVQRLLAIIATCLALPALACALILRDPLLGEKQSLDEAEGGAKEVSPELAKTSEKV